MNPCKYFKFVHFLIGATLAFSPVPSFAGFIQTSEQSPKVQVGRAWLQYSAGKPGLVVGTDLGGNVRGHCTVTVAEAQKLGMDLVSLGRLLMETNSTLICNDITGNIAVVMEK